MAVCKFGPIVSDVRGAVGGVVFSRSRSGSFIRSRVKPINRISNSRSDWADALTQAYGVWLNDMSDVERATWNTLASNTLFTNALGDTYNPSGWNLFLRTNAYLFFIESPPVQTAPATAVATHLPFVITNNVAGDQVYADVSGAAQADDEIIFWVSSAQPHTKFYWRGPYVKYREGPGNTWNAGPMAISSSGTVVGDRVFLRDRIMNVDGAFSSPFYTLYDIT